MLLTVFIPTYNAMPHLPQAVASILRQSWTEFRLLIIDDGSTDGTGEYLRSIEDPRVGIVRQENRGAGATANRGLEMCETPFLARMDADDISDPERLALQMRAVLDTPAIGTIGTQISYLVDESLVPALPFPTADLWIRRALSRGRSPLCHSTLLFRTELARVAGGYRAKAFGEDIDFVMRLMDSTSAANLEAVLHYQRVHSGSGSFLSSRPVAVGRRYGLHCAALRRRHLPEPAFEEYLTCYNNRRLSLCRGVDYLEAWAAVQYRLHIIDRARGHKLRAASRLAAVAICRPDAVFSRITEVLGSLS